MVLLVAVEEGWAGVLGGEFYVNLGLGLDEHDIFENTVEIEVAGQTAQFETMAVQMDGMVVAAGVLEDQAVALAGAQQKVVQASLLQWLGDLIQVDSVYVTAEDSTLLITIAYTIIASQQQQTQQYVYGGASA